MQRRHRSYSLCTVCYCIWLVLEYSRPSWRLGRAGCLRCGFLAYSLACWDCSPRFARNNNASLRMESCALSTLLPAHSNLRASYDAWSRQGHSQMLSRVVGAVDASPPGPTGSNNRAGECNVQDSAAQRARSCPCLKCWNWSSGGAHSNHELTSCATAPQDVYGGGVAASTMAMSVDA
jgi:hypothetical protein